MTHYMALLGQSAAHLIFLMVLPMMLAELLVTTEIFSLLNRDNPSSKWHTAKRHTGRLLAVYYTVVVLYLLIAVVPSIQAWRGWVDAWAVWCLLLAVIPLWGVLLLSFNVIGKNASVAQRNKLHAIFLVVYLIVGHLAMIFGMANPEWIGYHAESPAMMHDHQMMQHDHNTMPHDMKM